MAQLSRPYQIGLAAIVVLAAAWLLLIHGHGNSPNGSTGPPTAQVSQPHPQPPAQPAKKPEGNAGTATGHGSASSLGAFGHAIEKARGAVTASKEEERKLAERSSRASDERISTNTGKSAETVAPTRTTSPAPAPAPAAPSPAKAAAPNTAPHDVATNPEQKQVEAQLAKGEIAVILFWNPKGVEDRLVHKALQSLRGDKRLKIGIDEAMASQVASFGTITRGVQVYATPTLLFVNKQGKALTLTGLQDSFAIAQAVREAQHA